MSGILYHFPNFVLDTGVGTKIVFLQANVPNRMRQDTYMSRRKLLYDLNTLKSHEVAAILGITSRTLRNWLQAKRIPEPKRDPETGFRLWNQQDVETIRGIMGVKR